MKVVRITVLEASLKQDLAEKYAVSGLEPCPILKPGQVFYATNTCPKGMCDAAWRTINQYVFALACGVREFYGGCWMKNPGEAITCCNDGLRPVYFRLEATEDEAGPFLGREEQR
ncbi:MAG: TIGR04076 family protein [Kiritimatiellae bacterium]|nr:TIGR04076 family protein [Kiritimatiellia bacterium]MBR0198293.1 TIGR04076 family protein [Kiritimatiellia bacterium]